MTLRGITRLALAWGLTTVTLSVIGAVVFLARDGDASPERVVRATRWLLGSPVSWVAAAICVYIGSVVRALASHALRDGWRAAARGAALFVLLPCAVIAGLGFAYRAYRADDAAPFVRDAAAENTAARARNLYARDGAVRGVNLVAGRPFGDETWNTLLRDNVEWVCLGPFGWQDGIRAREIRLNTEHAMWCETDTGIVAITREAHARGMHVMLKPHIWLMRAGGKWLADIDPGSDDAWRDWFASYRTFILHYAALAERAGIECFVVGAELRTATTTHPREWRAIIADVRHVYHGRLTYAANWADEVNEITFWDALDCIGVQAYYPLSAHASPNVQDLVTGWQPHLQTLRALHERTKKPVLFTEVGWKSTSDATIRPWEWTEHLNSLTARVSSETQANAYDAFFRTVWREKWFGGACVWKWYAGRTRAEGSHAADFTPQNKRAETVIARAFGRPRS